MADTELKSIPVTDEEWRKSLTPQQYRVLRQAGTEAPFTGEFVEVFDDGTYRCGACGNLLFNSDAKFHSSCGWPLAGSRRRQPAAIMKRSHELEPDPQPAQRHIPEP